MPARRLVTLGLALAAGCAAPGCASRQSVEPARIEVPGVAVEIAETGPWRELPPDRGGVAAAETGAVPSPAPCPIRTEPRTAPRPRPRPQAPVRAAGLPAPARRNPARVTPRGTPDPRPPAQIARERHLDHPTRIRAAKITFYCPRAYLAEVQLTGVEVKDPRPGRRIATGDARLTCRELTLEAAEIVLRVRDPGSEDVKVSARGNVAFVTDQRGRVLRHEDLRILMLKNDVVTPLR